MCATISTRKRSFGKGKHIMYDIIIFGATFAAAGIASQHKKRCLVIERRMQAGYEFFGALRFTAEETAIYEALKQCHTLFGTELISVQKTEKGFTCVTHGVNGYCTYYAKRVVDTRCNREMCLSKTYNLLIDSQEEPAFCNVHWERTEVKNRYLVCCPVPVSWGYPEARAAAMDVIRQFSETQRLVLLANEFDYQVKSGYPKTLDSILYLPSRAYENPGLAFEAGREEAGQ